MYSITACWWWSRVVTVPLNFPFPPSNISASILLFSVRVQAVWELISTYRLLLINCIGGNIPSFWERIKPVTHLSLHATCSPHTFIQMKNQSTYFKLCHGGTAACHLIASSAYILIWNIINLHSIILHKNTKIIHGILISWVSCFSRHILCFLTYSICMTQKSMQVEKRHTKCGWLCRQLSDRRSEMQNSGHSGDTVMCFSQY